MGQIVENNKFLIAFVGMPGSGKTEATAYLHKKGIPFVRFGDVTDAGLRSKGLPLTPEHERDFRENIRKELGMAAYAIESESRIRNALENHAVVAVDGLYSWGEYVYLKEKFPQLILIHVYARPTVRYERLAHRSVRPIPKGASRLRDIAELEKLDKGGPIAIADYVIENDDDTLGHLHQKIDAVLGELGVRV